MGFSVAGLSIFSNLLLLFVLALPAYGENNLLELHRRLLKESQEGPSKYEALAKLVALERLRGQQDEARARVLACDPACLKQIPADELRSWKLWLCTSTNKKSLLCAKN